MKTRIFFATESHRDAIDSLRMGEYSTARGFSVDLPTLRWRPSDSESFVLAAEVEGRLVSTMRGEAIDDLTLLENKLECPWEFPCGPALPCLLLSRAATLTGHRQAGLNLVLRYQFLRLALHHGLGALVGTFVAGSPREATLREMGYRFFENHLGWQRSSYRSLAPVVVALLDLRENGDRALAYCRERANLDAYPFSGELPELRYVRSI